eukprot:g3339.t1
MAKPFDERSILGHFIGWPRPPHPSVMPPEECQNSSCPLNVRSVLLARKGEEMLHVDVDVPYMESFLGLTSSLFCFVPRGKSAWSSRFFQTFFAGEGVVEKPGWFVAKETADFVLGDFKLSPGAGSLAPKETAKVIGTFTATEPKNWHHQIGIHVPGLQEDASDSRRGEGDGDTGYKEYLLSAQSATPGIDAGNVHSIFEEHYVAPTLEDAVAFAGRLAIRAFDEEARYFSFGPLPVQGQSSDPPDPARFRITNPNPIACDVKFEIKPTAVVGKDAPGYKEEVSWELPEVAADEEDVLDLGEVCVGTAKVVSFHINNSTAHTLRFQFPDSLPPPLEGIKIVPSIGHVLPGMKKQNL